MGDTVGSRKAAIALALLACACGSQRAAVPVPGDLHLRVATDLHTLLSQVHPSPEDDEERHDRLVSMFREVGCPQVEVREVDGSDLSSISCHLQGATNRRLVVAATYDEPLRKAAGDDWPSAAMLPSLYRALRVEPREHSFDFVAFVDGKNKRPGHGTPGGVRFYLDQLPTEERRQTIGLISLNGFGAGFGHGPIGVWTAQADPDLALDLRSVSKALELRTRQVQLKKYPAMNMRHLFEDAVPSIYLFIADPISGDFVGEYLDSYRVVSFYLAYVDQTLTVRREGRASAVAAAAEEEGQRADGTGPQNPGQHQGGEGDGLGAGDAVPGQDDDQGGVPSAGTSDRDG